jgi:glycosyltransferase involved in cell wall biosynthesis
MLDAMANRIPNLTAFYLTDREYMRSWSDPLESVKHTAARMTSFRLNLKKLETAQYLSLTMLCKLLFDRPRVVIFAPYSQVVAMAGALICRLRRVPYIVWYESHDESSVAPTGLRALGRFAKRAMLGRAAAVVVPGRMALRSALGLGVDYDSTFVATHAVDNEFYASFSTQESALDSVLGQIARYDYSLLYVGQSIPRKNLAQLLTSFRAFQAEVPGVCLVLAGVMPLHGLDAHPDVISVGFVQAADLRKLYAACDGVILPSLTEVWGLVVNEALASDRPVIVSSACGAAELVANGRDGVVFDVNDPSALKLALEIWFAGLRNRTWSGMRERLAARSSFTKMAQVFDQAIQHASVSVN